MPQDRSPTRIQQKNRAAILDAALGVFSAQGFRGATVDEIARSGGLSKPNLLYFPQSGLKPPTLVGKTFKRAPKALMTH